MDEGEANTYNLYETTASKFNRYTHTHGENDNNKLVKQLLHYSSSERKKKIRFGRCIQVSLCPPPSHYREFEIRLALFYVKRG